MKYYFCTLFGKNYTYKGLALYQSLLRECSDFLLWVLCMDQDTYQTLNKLVLDKVILIRLSDFEDEELLRVKGSRTFGEYCWTCTPSLPLFLLRGNKYIQIITYLDADLYFFSSPEPIYREFGRDEILIIPHWHASKYKQLELVHGKYNVGMLIFRNSKEGRACLKYWRKKCLDWCYLEKLHHKYGDQYYLEDFPKRFSGVHILNNQCADVAPWNVSSYEVSTQSGKVMINNSPLIFYHFAGVQIFPDDQIRCLHDNSLFTLSLRVKKTIYAPYLNELEKIIRANSAGECHFGFYGRFGQIVRLMRMIRKVFSF